MLTARVRAAERPPEEGWGVEERADAGVTA
jgi:hypothetical protein